ncbi:MAG: hypothetical protein ABR600_05205 [Actinomycetota bacterium]
MLPRPFSPLLMRARARRPVAVSVVAAAMVTAAMLAPPSAGAAGTGASPFLPKTAQARVDRTRAQVASTRAGLSGASFVDRVATMIRSNGESVPSIPSLPAPLHTARLTGVPVSIRPSVARLDAAVRRSTRMLRAFPAPAIRRALRAVHTDGSTPMPGLTARRPTGSTLTVPMPAFRFRKLTLSPTALRFRRATERASLLLAAALDRNLPTLRAWDGGATTSRAADGCDTVDQVPYLCIGTAGSDTYKADTALLIDPGGDDTYLNHAGAGTLNSQILVGVLVDLGGNDSYRPPNTADVGGSATAEGVGTGGVGFLVDEAGDDSYEASAPPTGPDSPGSALDAQGMGALGVGALFDLDGNDRYSATGGDGTLDEIDLAVQGDGLAGIGALVDTGGGNDVYRADAGAAEGAAPVGSFFVPSRSVAGQGAGREGSGTLVDDGGTDTFTITAAATLQQDAYPVFGRPQTSVLAQGAGSIGQGMLLEGPGRTTYSIELHGSGMAYNGTLAQGAAGLGAGVLDDLAGDDTYRILGSLASDHEITVGDSSTCTDPDTEETGPCTSARASVDANDHNYWDQLLYSQGTAEAGEGLLEDHGGNDTYSSVLSEHLHVHLHDALTDPQAPASLSVEGYGDSWNIAQGVGYGDATYGDSLGVLLDDAGNDTYTASSVSETDAGATSDDGPGDPQVVALSQFRPGMFVQGVAHAQPHAVGALLDLGGDGDRFVVSNENPVTTSPDPTGAHRRGIGFPLAQGAVDEFGYGLFVALGQHPWIQADPSQGQCPASPQPRRSVAWTDCHANTADPDTQLYDWYQDAGTASGFAPFASLTAPALSLLPGTPAAVTIDGTADLGARLTAPDGSPIAGALIRFSLQAWAPRTTDPAGQSWFNGSEVDAVTDSTGVARAVLPTFDQSPWGIGPGVFTFRLAATYDGVPGNPGWASRHVAQPVTVS